jgi:hypothetical protein
LFTDETDPSVLDDPRSHVKATFPQILGDCREVFGNSINLVAKVVPAFRRVMSTNEELRRHLAQLRGILLDVRVTRSKRWDENFDGGFYFSKSAVVQISH